MRTLGPDLNEDQTRAFRRTLSRFPTGVAVVTTKFNGADVGMTVNSFSSVSLEPPLVLWSLRKASKRYASFAQARAYVVNVLAADQSAVGQAFASQNLDPFANVIVRERYEGAPIISGCSAWFACQPFGCHDAGDHRIMVGEVFDFDGDSSRESVLFYNGVWQSGLESAGANCRR